MCIECHLIVTAVCDLGSSPAGCDWMCTGTARGVLDSDERWSGAGVPFDYAAKDPSESGSQTA